MQKVSRKTCSLVVLVSILISLVALLPLPGQASSGTGIQQAGTQSETPSETATLTSTLTLTETLQASPSPTASVSQTTPAPVTQTPSTTLSPTFSLTPAFGATTGFPSPTFSPTLSPQLPTATTISSVTVLPFPSFTLEFPGQTEVPALLFAPRQPDSTALAKGEPPSIAARLFRFWPLALLLIVWLFLATWFVLAQRQMD